SRSPRSKRSSSASTRRASRELRRARPEPCHPEGRRPEGSRHSTTRRPASDGIPRCARDDQRIGLVSSAAVSSPANWRSALPFARVGFMNMLAYRARYYVGVLTYVFNVAVYYFLWRAVFRNAGQTVAGMTLPDMVTYVAVGWAIRSFYFNE